MTRQLTAIMFTNIEGYTSLMQQDESKAVEMRERHREVFHRTTDKFHGKVLQYHGNSTLSIFSSAVEAVQCAKEMQLDFQSEPVIPVRIGIHLGDIIYSNEEVIGDGINVALQIESEAIPGSVLISEKVYDEVKNQPEIQARFLKSCKLDEIDKPVDVFAVSNSGLVVPDRLLARSENISESQKSRNRLLDFWNELKRRKVVRVITVYAAASYVMLELTSIVVEPLNLPEWTLKMLIILLCIGFVLISILSWVYDITPEGIKVTQPLKTEDPPHWSGDSDHDIENLIAKPRKVSWFRRNKIFKHYLLPLIVFAVLIVIFQYWESIFKNIENRNEKVLIPAQRQEENKEAVYHTDIAKSIINNSGNLEVAKAELDLALNADPDYASALYTYALIYLAEEDTATAKQNLHHIIKVEPKFSSAWNYLASLAFWQDSLELALSYTIEAVQNDPSNNVVAYNMAWQSEHRGFQTQAIEWYQKAISIDSSFTEAYSALGALYNDLNLPFDAILILRKSLNISPNSEHNFRIYKNLAESHFLLKEYDKALAYLGQSKALKPDFPETEKCFARLYEARGEADQSIRHWRRYLILENDTVKLLEAQNHLDSLKNPGPS